MQNKQQKYSKPSRYITFGSGWVVPDEEGNIGKIRCSSSPERNAKNNNGEGYRLMVVPVDTNGEQSGDAIAVENFVVMPTSVDKSKYESAPDFRVFFGVE